jgi:hypothetical protein
MCSRQSPFMSACDPLIQAERRFKARFLNRSRWDCSLAARRGCPVARCTPYRLLAKATSNRGLQDQSRRTSVLKSRAALADLGQLRANGSLAPAEGGVRSSTSSLPSIMA